jgi:hypothetical protein
VSFKMQAIVPKKLQLDPKRLGLAVEDALDEAAANVYAQFAQSHSTWKTRVTFTITRKPWQRAIQTDSKIYRFVNFGTRAHWIIARRKRALAFRTGGSPKTTPGVLASGSGSRGGTAVYRRRVRHPGTKARNFDQVILQEWDDNGRLRDTIQRHIDEAVQ